MAIVSPRCSIGFICFFNSDEDDQSFIMTSNSIDVIVIVGGMNVEVGHFKNRCFVPGLPEKCDMHMQFHGRRKCGSGKRTS